VGPHGRVVVIPSSYPVDALCTAAVEDATHAAAEVWAARTGRTQAVHVDPERALLACRSDQLVRVDGRRPGEVWSPISGFYPTADDRWVQLHTNFPHHLARTLAVLGAVEDRDAVARAIAERTGEELEDALAAAGACASLARTRAEWMTHPQYAAVRDLPRLDTLPLETPRPLPPADRPLGGVRVIDMTRVLAGPIAARTFAAFGADVLRVSSPDLPEIDAVLPDTALGKRSAFCDFRDVSQLEEFRALTRSADVVIQSYRPGALAALGVGPELNPNAVWVSLSAYSHAGPWAGRRGYDTLVQTATGIAVSEGDAFGMQRPRHVPVSALDHSTGYFAAAAAMRALVRGGGHVRCSLVQTREFLETLGRVDNTHLPRPDDDAIIPTLPTIASDYGLTTYAPYGGDLPETPAQWDHGAEAPGSSPLTWLEISGRTSPTSTG
jgi:crotonobetainyl-CoA:carnitine CoA-transferase CaiB-like acyl-CoA transferase